jgi:glycerophosphoryl diester phosphodiesterase
MRNNLKLIAHRGYSGRYPENTLISFQKAIDVGAKFIEFDIQYTKDKKLAVIHDFTLERTTNGKGNISDYTMAELKSFSAGYQEKFANHFIEEKIPSIEEVIELCKDKAQLLIEIKRRDNLAYYDDGMEESLANVINYYEIQGDVMIVSFNLFSLAKMKSLIPGISVGCLFYKIDESSISHAVDIDASFIIFNYKNYHSHELIEKAKLAGLLIGLYTIDKRNDFEKFRYGVDAIATNYIKEMLDYFLFSANL